MTNTSVQRRLAAILAADVVAYSRLMQADEVGTLEALKAHRRELIDPVIASHRGQSALPQRSAGVRRRHRWGPTPSPPQ